MALGKERGLDIRVDSPTCLIRTRPDLPSVSFDEEQATGHIRPSLINRYFAFKAIRIESVKFIFYGPPVAHTGQDPFVIPRVLLAVSAMIAIAYAAIWSLRKPVRELTLGEILESARLNCVSRDFVPVETERVSFIHELLENYRKDAIRISFTAQNASVLVWVDPSRIVNLLRNVIHNALKYSSGLVSNVEMTLTSHVHSVEISLRDYGIAIPEADLGYIFEPFY